MKNGWIKISRRISDHWLWDDAERLQWWLDLLLMASWQDTEAYDDTHHFTLHRGQLIASVSYLSNRWRRSAPTILKFLRLLEDDKMITRETIFRKTAIITIVNYTSYQAPLETNTTELSQQLTTTQDEEMKQLAGERIWADAVKMKFQLDEQQFQQRLVDFYEMQKCLGNEANHESISDAKRHFTSWLNKTNSNYVRQQTNNRRKGTEATATRAEDFKTDF